MFLEIKIVAFEKLFQIVFMEGITLVWKSIWDFFLNSG